MTQIPAAHARRLSAVADDLREVFAERGHRVDVALDTDPAFGSGNSRSSLRRDLALATIAGATGRAGLDFRNVQGGREIRTLNDCVDRRYRLLKAQRRADGEFYIPTNSDSALAFSEDSLFDQERWVFAWTFTTSGFVDDVFAAEIRGHVEGSPGHLTLGPVTPLGSDAVSHGGFQPRDEDLPGFEDEEGTDDESGWA